MNTENITITESPDTQVPVEQSSPFLPKEGQTEVNLVNIEVTDDNVALNLIVSYLNVAQRRGVFNLDESAKIWECIQRFIVKKPSDDVV